MTSDIQKLIDDSALRTSAQPEILVRENAAVRLPKSALWKAARKTSPRFRLLQSYARKLAHSIRFIRIHLIFLQVTWAPAEKTALLESHLRRQKIRLKRITRKMKFACLDTLQRKDDPRHPLPGKLKDVGVKGYQNKHDRIGFRSRGRGRTSYILWDNW